MAINAERIRGDIEAIAAFTQTPGEGATRPTFSTEWGRARDYVIDQAYTADCKMRIDAAGNVHARPAALGWSASTWLCGSHIDSVPHGGDYDGVAGVAVALEVLRSAREDGLAALPMELVIFAEEEGPTFGLGMLGSRALVGEIDAPSLEKLKNSAGQSYLEAGEPYGVQRDRIAADLIDASSVLGMVEVHIEQGPGMWRRGQRLALVRAIAGRRQYRVVVRGDANHAGATAMQDRRDALVGAAEMVVAIEALARELDGDAVATVGRIIALPNAVNVIADSVEFTIDLRAPADGLLAEADRRLREAVAKISQRRGVAVEICQTEAVDARPMNDLLLARLARSARQVGVDELPMVVSGALHDSAILAPHVATAMLFVPSRDGISHNPTEFSRVEDIALAARIVESLVRRPVLGEVNGMNELSFLNLLGGVFEHSQWVAKRVWEVRPFASVGALHEAMCSAAKCATSDEQLALIRAHPDLVGRLAQQGRLTRESNEEQASAGLDELNHQEIELFERYNEAYRERFGFPFVICAREHRKAAILDAFPVRLERSREAEMAEALQQIFAIARHRLADIIWEDA